MIPADRDPQTGGNVLYPWSSARIVTPLAIGGVGLGLFMLYEHRFALQPILPLRILSNRTAASGYYMTFCHALILWAFAYYMNLYVSSAIILNLLKL